MTGTIIVNADGTTAIAVVKRKLGSTITAKSASALTRRLRPPRPQKDARKARKSAAILNGKAMAIATMGTTYVGVTGTEAIAVASRTVISTARSANV